MAKIKIKRGLEENLPTLEVGELALTTDSEKVLVGTASGNKELGGGVGIVINEWQELTLLNSYTGYVKVRKNALGQVEIIMNITNPETFKNSIFCVIPYEFQPPFNETLFVRQNPGGNAYAWYSSSTGNLYGGNIVNTAGVVITGHAIFLQE